MTNVELATISNDCKFLDLKAKKGAAILAVLTDASKVAELSIEETSFTNNIVDLIDGGYGGAIYSDNVNLVLKGNGIGNTFDGNQAYFGGSVMIECSSWIEV